MAKFIGLVGTGSGKAGNFVFSKGEDGQTIARAYQPKVANPRTDLQILQRAKMNTVGQFSALCPAALLAPIGKGTKRKNRSAFARNLLYKAKSELVEGGAKAYIDPEDVIFSKGAQQLLTEASTPVVDESSVSVTLTPNIPTELLGRYGERIVVAILDDSNNEQYDAVIYQDTTIETNTAQTVTLDISGVPIEQGQTVVVWRMAFRLAAAAAGLSGDGVHISSDGITASIGSSSTRITVDQVGSNRPCGHRPFRGRVVINSVDPPEITSPFHHDDTITIYGQHLDELPDEVCLCVRDSREAALEYIDYPVGSLASMPVKERDESHITFHRTAPGDASFVGVYRPYFITTPYEPPRHIVHEFQY